MLNVMVCDEDKQGAAAMADFLGQATVPIQSLSLHAMHQTPERRSYDLQAWSDPQTNTVVKAKGKIFLEFLFTYQITLISLATSNA